MATTVSAVLAALRVANPYYNPAAWNALPSKPMTIGQHTNAMSVLNAGTVTTGATALSLVAQAGLVSGVTPVAVTVTSATPAVVTWTTHGLAIGQSFMFIGGTAPAGATNYTPYFIISTLFTANSFEFSASLAGAAINTTDTGTSPTCIPIGGAYPQASEKQIWDLLVTNRADFGA